MKNLESRQLRIGNLLLGRGAVSQVLEVYENHIKTEKENKIPMRIVQGITLTEEWLVKFGVNKLHKNIKVSYWNDDFLHEQMTLRINETLIKIKHVHQLQNLYFALTGEELTLKQ